MDAAQDQHHFLRGLLGWPPDLRDAARRGSKLAVYAAEAGDYALAADTFRAMGLPESAVWECLQPSIEANADDPEDVFAQLYEPDFEE